MHVHCPTSGLVGTEHREVSPTDRIHNVCTQCTLHIALLHNAHNTLNIAQCTLHRSQCNATAGLIRYVWTTDHTMVQSRDASTDFYQIVTNDDTHMTIVVQLSHRQDNCDVARLSCT